MLLDHCRMTLPSYLVAYAIALILSLSPLKGESSLKPRILDAVLTLQYSQWLASPAQRIAVSWSIMETG